MRNSTETFVPSSPVVHVSSASRDRELEAAIVNSKRDASAIAAAQAKRMERAPRGKLIETPIINWIKISRGCGRFK
jgi:hypothetical protein